MQLYRKLFMRRMTIFVAFIISGVLFWQMASAGRSGPSNEADPTQVPHLGYFPALPKAIDGCVGTFTYDSVSLKKEKYIFVENLQELAFLYVSGKVITLKKIKDLAYPGGKKFRTEYEGSGYNVIFSIREIRQIGDEGGYFDGTLEVRYGQTSQKLKIHGESGC